MEGGGGYRTGGARKKNGGEILLEVKVFINRLSGSRGLWCRKKRRPKFLSSLQRDVLPYRRLLQPDYMERQGNHAKDQGRRGARTWVVRTETELQAPSGGDL